MNKANLIIEEVNKVIIGKENGNTGIRENTAPIGHKKRQKNLGSNAIPAVTNKKRPVPIRLSCFFA